MEANITIHTFPPHIFTLSPIEDHRTHTPTISTTPKYNLSWLLRGQPVIVNPRNHSEPVTVRPWRPATGRTTRYPTENASQHDDRHFWKWIYSGGHWHRELAVHANASWHYGNVSPIIRRFTTTTTRATPSVTPVEDSGDGSDSSGSGSEGGSGGSASSEEQSASGSVSF